ncbi:major facilitator superfamily domain-containing protein, partial [Suillus paluster]|uniref:major facilitator superfamily domain-containing protein n=1 Tax=Suillus paluster TaxID=48578 RepID=UPI001B86CD4E
NTEESPLFEGHGIHIPDDLDGVHDRFSKAQKNIIVFAVSFAGVLPSVVRDWDLVSSIPQIAHDLDSTSAAVSLAVSLSVFANVIGCLVWAVYSSVCRFSVLLLGMPILCIGSFGGVVSTTLMRLLFRRLFQAFGCAGGLSVGAAAISDIYRVEQRGTAMGIFFGVRLLGVALSPITGSTAAHHWSWRSLHCSLVLWGFIEMVLLYPFLPETSHPCSGLTKPFWINPFNSLWLLRSPNIMAFVLLLTMHFLIPVLSIPIAYTIGVRYHISNEALIGVCFLPSGLGNFTMHTSAFRVVFFLFKHKLPHQLLGGAVLVGGLFVPLSVCLSGLVTTYIAGPLGLVLNLLRLFMNGIGVNFVLTPIGSYNVDVLQSRSAEVIVAVTTFRAIILAPVIAAVLPSIETLGVAATNGIATVICAADYHLTIRYGDHMRAWVDVGHTIITNQT